MKKFMKNVFCLLVLTSFIASCNQEPKTASQVGVYKMEKALINDGIKDTSLLASDGNTQYKIYTPSAYFYIAIGKDSSVGFGLGTYTQHINKISEANIYNGGTLDTASTAILEITRNEKGYSQLIPEFLVSGKKYKWTEEYTSIASNGESSLNGVWHQTKNIEINGKDSVDRTYNEYKVFQGGHFMWAARYLVDSSKNKFSNIVGMGTFTLNNDSLTENLEMSSMKGITGKYNINIKVNGPDEFSQTTTDTTSHSIGIKTYKRISK